MIEFKIQGHSVPLPGQDQERLSLKQLQEKFHNVFDSPEGAIVLGHILIKMCKLVEGSYTIDNSKHTEFLEGGRHIGTSIMFLMNATPGQLERKAAEIEKEKEDETII